MTNLTSFSIIDQKVKKTREELGLNSSGLAFDRVALEVILKINEDEIEEAITDGPMDGEVDAIYIEDRTVHIFTCKYTEKFEKTKSNFPEGEIDQFIVTIQNLLAKNIRDSTYNEAIRDKYLEMLILYEDGPLNFKFYVVSNKLKPVEHAKKKLEDVLASFRFVEVFYYELEDLVTRLLDNKGEQIDGKIKFIDRQHFEKSNGSIKTIIGSVPACDLIELIKDKDDPQKINESVFEKNIRVYKPDHSINKGIIDSALDENNYQFFYLNNGITILCDECEYTPNTRSPIVPIYNFQIINGGQTSHSLFEAFKQNREKIENIELLARICIAKRDHPISEMISETTNSQIPVGTRDLHSNDLIQRKLQLDFEQLGYYYERKPNQFIDKPIHLRLNNEILGQVYLAFHFDMPSEAKNSKRIVFAEKYEDIYNDKLITAKEFIKLFKIFRILQEKKAIIQQKKRNREFINEADSFVSRATFHLLNAIKYISQIENLDLENPDHVNQAVDKSISILGDLVKETMVERGSVYTHDKFFKELATNKLIIKYIADRYRNAATSTGS